MDIDRLQKALAIINKDGKSGNVFAEHDGLFLWPETDSFSKEEVDQLEALGFRVTDEGSVECFT